MDRHHGLVRLYSIFTAAILITFIGAACGPSAVSSTSMPVLQTAVAQETNDIVTQVTETPDTLTPTFTPTIILTSTITSTPTITFTPSLTPTITRTPSITPTPAPPVVAMQMYTPCLFGPGDYYLWIVGINETAWMEVIGRNMDGSWLLVEELYIKDKHPCWLRTDHIKFNDGGDVTTHTIPIVDPDIILPFARNLYLPPSGVQAFRSGSEVTIYWNAVWMTEDDYNGYLIEAWLCQAGQQVFKPVFYITNVNQNVGTLGVKVTDEPGCVEPSHARIYTVEKHGYTGYVPIPWPAYDTPTTPAP
jgi:hypothetical protein